MNAYTRIAAGLIVGFQLMGLVACNAGPMDEQEGAEAPAVAPQLATAHQPLVNGEKVRIRAAHTGKCVDIEGASPYPLAKALQWSCWGGSNQTFDAESQPDGSWIFKVEHTGWCLTVQNYSSGAALWQYTCSNTGNGQYFTLHYNSNGTITLKTRDGNQLCAEVYNFSYDNGAPLKLYTCNSGLNQQFYIERA